MSITKIKYIPGTTYTVTSNGEVFNKKGQKLNPFKTKGGTGCMQKGYLVVTLHHNGKMVRRTGVHRLIAEAFVNNPENKPFVTHINGDPQDNRADNLVWIDYSDRKKYWAAKAKLRKTCPSCGKNKYLRKLIEGVKYCSRKCFDQNGKNKCKK